MKIYKFISLLLVLMLVVFNGILQSQTLPLRVNSMPSYANNEREGNAIICQPIIIWGSAFGGTPPYTFTIKVDGVPVSIDDYITDPQAYGYNHYAGRLHTFQLLGLRTVRVEVTDNAGNTGFSESIVNVYADPIPPVKVAMRIDKALLYLYKNALTDAADPKNIYWNCPGALKYMFAATATSVMAFEEAGHFDINDFYVDPYAELVKKGLHFILTKYSGQLAIYDHPDGFHTNPISDNFQAGGPTGNGGSGKGSYLFNISDGAMYASCLGFMAFAMSRHSPEAAAASVIDDGPFAGWTFLDLMKDAIDLLAFSQGDFANRGTWRYYFFHYQWNTDGSTEQWPILVMKAAKDLWGIEPPVWLLENAAFAYQTKLLNTNGGCGYETPTDKVNIGKTGGFLIFCSLFPSGVTPDIIQNSVNYIQNKYLECGPQSCNEYGGPGWTGSFYHMYAMMKGLTLHNIDNLNVPGVGYRDWYKDMVAWLTGEKIYELPAGMCSWPWFKTIDNAYGQDTNGSWRDDGCLGCVSLATAHAILILLRTVTYLPPVAVIDPPLCSAIIIDCDTFPPPQNNCLPLDSAFRISGLMSYHMGAPQHNIVNYFWAVDPPPDFNWQNATITGPHPLIPGFTTPGVHTICLRVEDDRIPPLYDIECVDIWVCDTSVTPAPIAKAIPDSLMPCYTAKPTIPLTLDGSESYIPPNCETAIYMWDIDGNNTYDTMIINSPYLNVTYNFNGSFMVGLIVLCVHNGDTVMSCADYACLTVSSDDLLVTEFTASCIHKDQDSVTLQMTFQNHTLSEHSFTTVAVNLYNGNPTTSGVYLGYTHSIPNFVPGQTATWTITIPYQTNYDTLWVWIDPYKQVEEWNEFNNLAKVFLSHFGKNDTVYLLEDHDTLINVTANDVPEQFPNTILVGLGGFPANGFAFPTGSNGNPIYYLPNLNFNGIDSVPYLLRILNLNGNDYCEDTLWIIIYVIPVNDAPYLKLPNVIICQNDSALFQLNDYQVFHDPDDTLPEVSFTHRFLTMNADTTMVNVDVNVPQIKLSTGFQDYTERSFLLVFTAEDDSGAMASDTVQLTVHASPQVQIPDTSYCQGSLVSLNAGNPGATFLWSNGLQTQSIQVANPGSYRVTVTNTFGCKNSDTVVVTERPVPQLLLTSELPMVCQGDTVRLHATSSVQPGQTTYTWYPGGLTGNSVVIQPYASMYYDVTGVLHGCQSKDSIFIPVKNNPVIHFNQDVFTLCPGDSMIVQVTEDVSCSPATYLWSTGSTSSLLYVVPQQSGYYSVTVSCASGCWSTDSVKVQFSIRPSIVPIPPQRVCLGDTLQYTAEITQSNIASQCLYQWNNGIIGPTLVTAPQYPATYLLTVTYQVCKDTASLFVDVFNTPEVNLPDYLWLEAGETKYLNAGPGAIDYLWSNNYYGQILTVTDTGKYWVRVRNLVCENSDTTYVYAEPNVFVPNCFTPNEDGTNDVFYAFCAAEIQFKMWIFNRWGECIFETNDLYKGWDGKFNGSDAPIGVYTWMLEYNYTTPGPYYLQKNGKKSGMVVLLR